MKIDSYLENLVQHLGLEEGSFKINLQDLENEMRIDLQVPEEDAGLFIGYKAEVINSIQRMLRIIFSKDYEDKKIILNINNYRENRIAQLQERVSEICSKLVEKGDEYIFPPLSSFERFSVHSLISENESFVEFESFSEGENQNRRLIIRKK